MLLAITSACALFAQTNTAVIGIVTDPAGASVPGAKAVVTNSETGVVNTATTNDAGAYLLPDIPPGSYTLTVERQGFRRYVRRRSNRGMPGGTCKGTKLSSAAGANAAW